MHAIAIDNQQVPVPATSLVGRDEEINRLIALLIRPDVRLVTLLGPGGVGKTRLAFQIAHDIDRDLAGPVRLVLLANITEGADIIPAIARALGTSRVDALSAQDEIIEEIGDRPMLLILDNAEQLADRFTFLSEMINRCPRLTIMVTSRVMLRLSFEHVFALDPLSTTSAGKGQLAPATALFVDRARLVQPELQLTDENIRAIDTICQQVDGLPLAIELAAARTRFLSPVALCERLTERLSMLVGGPRDVPERHRTLRATLAWSHDLLSSDERILFRRLGIAVNGLPYDAVDPICNSAGDLDGHVEELLDALVDHSLVRIDDHPDTGPRVRLLHTIREFAGEQLELSGEMESIQRAHALWYARMVIETPVTTWGTGRPELRLWTLRHLPDRETFSTVLRRLLEWGEHKLACQMTAQLVGFWSELGQIREARTWCDRVMPYVADMPIEIQANLYFKAALIVHMEHDVDTALDYATRSLEMYEQIGDLRSLANVHNVLGNLQWQMGNPAEGERHQREAIAATEAAHNVSGTAMFKAQLADRLAEHGKYDEAEQMLEEAEPIIARERPEALPLLLGSKAVLYLMTDRLNDAGRCLHESLRFYVAPPHRRPDMLAQLLLFTANFAARRGFGDEGTMILAAALSIFQDIGMKKGEMLGEETRRIEASLRDLTGQDRFNERWRQGQNASIPDTIAMARDVCERIPAESAPEKDAEDDTEHDLTPRERQVLRLLVEGRSNAEIADELFISPRTVTTHLTRLYAKLDVTSRTGAISAAIRMGMAAPS